jgi:hypothetical protein
VEIAHKIATEGPPDLCEAWPNAPRAAADVLKRAMALAPEDRPESAGEFARELAEALKDEPTKTAPTRRFRKTRPRRAAAAGAAAGAAAAPAAARADNGEDTPTPKPAPAATRGRRRPGLLVPLLAIALIALTAAAIAGAVLSGGDDNSSGSADTPAAPAKKKEPQA